MKCSYCTSPAQFKCCCEYPYMWQIHFGSHIFSVGNHPFENLNASLTNSKVKKLQLKIYKRLQQIEEAKNELCLKTKSLIIEIEKNHKELIKKLDLMSEKYFSLLNRNIFFDSEILTIYEIDSMKITIKEFKN